MCRVEKRKRISTIAAANEVPAASTCAGNEGSPPAQRTSSPGANRRKGSPWPWEEGALEPELVMEPTARRDGLLSPPTRFGASLDKGLEFEAHIPGNASIFLDRKTKFPAGTTVRVPASRLSWSMRFLIAIHISTGPPPPPRPISSAACVEARGYRITALLCRRFETISSSAAEKAQC